MRRQFSETQILGFLRAAATGTPVMDLCWNHCFSRSTFRAWRKRYGEAIDVGGDRLRALELENARLRKALAHRLSAIESPRRASPAFGGNSGTDRGAKPALPGRAAVMKPSPDSLEQFGARPNHEFV